MHRTSTPALHKNELDIYLETGPERVHDPIGWWYERRVEFPNLSRMAMDYLGIPGELAVCQVCPFLY